MDINAALARMRNLAADPDSNPDDIREQWDAIDGWLSAGGFRPAVWEVRMPAVRRNGATT